MFTFFLLLVGLAASFASPVLLEEQTLGGRIVGGRDGTIEEVPYLVSILFSGRHTCGGAIINEYWVLSAAHCFKRDHSQFTIRAGSTLRTSGGIIHAVETIINHKSHGSPTSHANDIALLKVVQPFQYSDQVQPIALPKQLEGVAAGTVSIITGWGQLQWLIGPTPLIVQIAEVPVVSQEQCRSVYSDTPITDDMLCAGLPQGGIDSCQGDSGGPLAIDGVLQGVVSWGRGCAVPPYPGVYARVSYFRDWITENSGV